MSLEKPSDVSSNASRNTPETQPRFLGKSDPTPGSMPPPASAGKPSNAVPIFLMVLALSVVGFFTYRDAILGMPVGGPTQFAWKVVTPEGTPVDLASYRGRPVLLNVWATWCGPCLMEMPSLIALSQRPELKEANVAIVLVSTDGDLDPVRRFLSKTDIGAAEVLIAAEMPPPEFSTAGIPATFLIDPAGTIVRSEVGAMDWNTDKTADELVALARAR